jgi:hypothetical protein
MVQKVETKSEHFKGRSKYDFFYPFDGDKKANKRHDGSDSDIGLREPSYFMRSNFEGEYVDESYSYTTLVNNKFHFQFRLSDIRNSIFDIDKDLMINEVLILRIEWNQTNKYIYTTTADSPVVPANTQAGFSIAPTIRDLTLYLAKETDQSIINAIQQKVMSGGLSLILPYIYHSQNTIRDSSSHTITIRSNSSNGFSMCKVYSAAFNTDEKWDKTYDHSNIDGTKVSSYYTLLDNTRLTEYDITCRDIEPRDYMNMKATIKGTCLEPYGVFKYNWVHVDDFCNAAELQDDPNVVVGIPLTTSEKKWDLYANVPLVNGNNQSFTWYTFTKYQRRLMITSQAVQVM